MEDKRAKYSDNLIRNYGYGALPNHSFTKEKPSEYKLSLLNNLPVQLISDEIDAARIYINRNCELIFESNGNRCYYSDVKNSTIEKYRILESSNPI